AFYPSSQWVEVLPAPLSTESNLLPSAPVIASTAGDTFSVPGASCSSLAVLCCDPSSADATASNQLVVSLSNSAHLLAEDDQATGMTSFLTTLASPNNLDKVEPTEEGKHENEDDCAISADIVTVTKDPMINDSSASDSCIMQTGDCSATSFDSQAVTSQDHSFFNSA
ncbi:unnamed protein product, partial [Protopolystoma xenopodis]